MSHDHHTTYYTYSVGEALLQEAQIASLSCFMERIVDGFRVALDCTDTTPPHQETAQITNLSLL